MKAYDIEYKWHWKNLLFVSPQSKSSISNFRSWRENVPLATNAPVSSDENQTNILIPESIWCCEGAGDFCNVTLAWDDCELQNSCWKVKVVHSCFSSSMGDALENILDYEELPKYTIKKSPGKQQFLKKQICANLSSDLFSSRSLYEYSVLWAYACNWIVETCALRLLWECCSGCGLILQFIWSDIAFSNKLAHSLCSCRSCKTCQKWT